MPKFAFYAAKTETTTENFQQLKSLQPNMQVQEFTALSVRSADAKPEEIETADDDVVIVQLSNDVEWHYRADEFESFITAQPNPKRSGKNSEHLEIPSFFVSPDGTRGGVEEVIKTKGIKLITGMVAKGAARLLVEKMESGLNAGLHGLNDKMEFTPFEKSKAEKGKPYLLFIHGTNSNTEGAFKDLIRNDAYAKLFKFYGGRIIAFEHRTLSESPLKNITDLLQALPDEIMLDVVSHSRGGIVADLLARCSNGGQPFDKFEIRTINSNGDFASLKEEAKAANAAAGPKTITLGKMIRVACPAAGTVLIDKRMDNVVNVFCNLLKLIPGAAACMPFTLFLDFAKAVVHERTDIDVFPGVAAQIPGSPLIRMLNNPNRTITSELYVISGDVERSGIWKSMLVMSTNLYFGEAHDLVVNTNSMFKGTYRSASVKEHFEQEAVVNHFNYFKNPKSQEALLAALTDPQKAGSLYETIGATKDIITVHERGEAMGKKPAVFLLPGIMNSHLKDTKEKQRLWINFIGIVTGQLKNLGIGNPNIEAEQADMKLYGKLINFLSPDFDVYPFPYDWRMDLVEAADKLAAKVDAELKSKARENKEVHFITHSMGGLVLRAFIKRHDKLWKQISSGKKTKVLMMGVPNKGSFGTMRILLGKDSVVKKLALLDFANSKKELLTIFKDYPGLVQLLPGKEENIFNESLWKKLEENNDEFTAIPSAAALQKGAAFYNAISDTNFDNDIFRYIAGQSDSTPESYEFKNGKVIFKATSQGDGRVLWSTIPSSLQPENIYYVPAEHGDIPKYEKAFEGFKQLLQQGKSASAALANTKPFTRGGLTKATMPDSDIVSMPTAAELEESLLSNREAQKKTAAKQTINLSVINGDLVHSRYPVVVGHFKGDGIVKAEWYLNKALGFKLSEYHLVNNYPGDIGTHLVILNEKDSGLVCKGGVVVGLGEFGSLTENRMLVSLTQAFLTLAIKFNELLAIETNRKKNAEAVANGDAEPPIEEAWGFGISSLLVGSDFAGLRISTSIKTILLAVLQANEKLDAMSSIETIPFTYKKITNVELVEIYQHKSIQCGRLIKNFLEQDAFSSFRFSPPVIIKGSGAKKIIVDESLQDNWHRLEISVVGNDDGKTEKHRLPIRFTAITDKAHADQELVPANRVMVETLIEKTARHSQWNKSFSQTLYELLIPNGFKGYGSSLRNMVLIVDEQTARYPWELLHDANGISDKPLVINTGIVRQLKTGSQRVKAVMNSSNRALVIGEPLMDPKKYPPLPGAKAEAERLVPVFVNNGLEVTPSINEDENDIVPKLVTKSYKIIHIASHGIVGDTMDEPTGVVLGDNIIFTSADFNTIPVVPEFVFINCCSSNDYNPAIAEKMRKKYNLAASVGSQLIQMGVKAAIVTGWEIDDAGAATFCDTFYDKMFKGETFGEAVRAAREATYNQHGYTNTWGAYQCYGDPYYIFKTSKASIANQKPVFADVEEVVYELDNFMSELTSSSKRKTAQEAEKRITAITSALYPEWKKNGRVVERVAELYRVIDMLKEALDYYEQLFVLENAAYTVKAVERYFITTVRHTQRELNNKKTSLKDAKKKVADAIEGLKKLNGETIERHTLIAASYRRFFELDKKDVKLLIHAAHFYKQSYEYALKTSTATEYYPYFNWLHFSLLLSEYKNAKGNGHLNIPEDWKDTSQQALAYAKKQDEGEPDFYAKTAPSAYAIALILSATKEADIAKHKKTIVANFNDAWARDGNSSQRDSYISYIIFLAAFIRQKNAEKKQRVDAAPKKLEEAKAKALEDAMKEVNK